MLPVCFLYIANKTRSSKGYVAKSTFTRKTNYGHYSSIKVSYNISNNISMGNYTITVIQHNDGRTVITDNDEEASRFSIL